MNYISILKSIGAVIAGFLTVAVLSIATDAIVEALGIFPPQSDPNAVVWWMLVIALTYRTVYTVLGGYITAWLAPNNTMRHVWILAFLGLLGGTAGLISHLDTPQLWYPIMLVVLAIPSVWFGGYLYMTRMRQA
jgi:hypothetical protein